MPTLTIISSEDYDSYVNMLSGKIIKKSFSRKPKIATSGPSYAQMSFYDEISLYPTLIFYETD